MAKDPVMAAKQCLASLKAPERRPGRGGGTILPHGGKDRLWGLDLLRRGVL
jgi:hypothetical protein